MAQALLLPLEEGVVVVVEEEEEGWSKGWSMTTVRASHGRLPSLLHPRCKQSTRDV